MDFNALSQSRRSIRDFENKSILKEDITKLLIAAQSAPSAGNCQPWHFYVVRDKAIREELKDASYGQKFVAAAPICIVVCADIKRTIGRYGDRGRHLYCLQDTAAAVQNILLCAKSLGLGTCWIGAFEEEKVSQILKLEEDMRPVAIIPVGYPANEPFSTERRALDKIVTFIGEDNYT